MTLLDELVEKYHGTDLGSIFTTVGINTTKVNPIHRPALKEVTLAQWLLESGRATSKLAKEATNFSGLKWRSEMQGFATPHLIQVPSEPTPVKFCKFDDIDMFIIGYWKFLTRSPYQGLEDHTHNPNAFIGFLQRKGFAADPSYVNKVLNLLSEAQGLLAQVNGNIPLLTQRLQVTRFPREVEVRKEFRVEGVASQADAGKILLINVDNQFPSSGAAIGPDRKWAINFVFFSPGTRTMSISTDRETVEIDIDAQTPIDNNDDEETLTPLGSVAIQLSGSVGVGGVNNPEDVKAIKKRLNDLGYTWAGDPTTGARNRGLDDAIRLFQSIIFGRSTVAGDGRVDVGATTHRWLQAANAPNWRTMPASNAAISFVNFELEQTNDNHDFGTNWIADTILAVANAYHTSHRNTNPGSAPFAINDVSIPHGGDTPDHSGHETGLMCDVLLPRKDGDFGATQWFLSSYDQSATQALLESIQQQRLVRAVFFNDPDLIDAGLCSHASGHDNHIHFEIDPPVRQ